jgi:hypothetical protein
MKKKEAKYPIPIREWSEDDRPREKLLKYEEHTPCDVYPTCRSEAKIPISGPKRSVDPAPRGRRCRSSVPVYRNYRTGACPVAPADGTGVKSVTISLGHHALCLPTSIFCPLLFTNPKSQISALRVFLDHSPYFRLNFIRFYLNRLNLYGRVHPVEFHGLFHWDLSTWNLSKQSLKACI